VSFRCRGFSNFFSFSSPPFALSLRRPGFGLGRILELGRRSGEGVPPLGRRRDAFSLPPGGNDVIVQLEELFVDLNTASTPSIS